VRHGLDQLELDRAHAVVVEQLAILEHYRTDDDPVLVTIPW
jgi:hypothetical protein